MHISPSIIAGAILLFSIPQVTMAQGAGDVAQKWGLLGTWAEFCDRPPSLDNSYAIFVRRGGKLFFDRHFGNGSDQNEIVAASILPDGMISITIDFSKLKERRINVFVLGADGKRRAMINSDTHGNFSVKNGILLSSNRPTVFQTRCNDASIHGFLR